MYRPSQLLEASAGLTTGAVVSGGLQPWPVGQGSVLACGGVERVEYLRDLEVALAEAKELTRFDGTLDR